MTKAEARRLMVAEAEVERLRAETVRQAEIINRLIHQNVRVGMAVREALSVLDEVRDDVR